MGGGWWVVIKEQQWSPKKPPECCLPFHSFVFFIRHSHLFSSSTQSMDHRITISAGTSAALVLIQTGWSNLGLQCKSCEKNMHAHLNNNKCILHGRGRGRLCHRQTRVVRLPTLSGTIYAGSVGPSQRTGLHVLQRAQSIVPSAACAAGPFSLLPTITQPGRGCDWLNSNHRSDWPAINVRGEKGRPRQKILPTKTCSCSACQPATHHMAQERPHTHIHNDTVSVALCQRHSDVQDQPAAACTWAGRKPRLLTHPARLHFAWAFHGHCGIHTLLALAFTTEAWSTDTNVYTHTYSLLPSPCLCF